MQIAGALLILLILLLAVPVSLVFSLKKDGVWRGRIIVYWMFGLTRMTIRPGRVHEWWQSKRRRPMRKLIVSGGRGLVRRRRDLLTILRAQGFMRQLIYLVRDVLQSLKPRRFRIQFIIGMDDPADTGRMMGVLAPLRVFTGQRTIGKASNVSLQITLDFSGPRFTGYSCASIQFVPLKMIVLFLGFAISLPALRAARALIRRPNANNS